MNLEALMLRRAEEQMRSSDSWRLEREAADAFCVKGHPLDGVKTDGHGRRMRYCRTCHRERERLRKRTKRAQTAGLAPAFEEG